MKNLVKMALIILVAGSATTIQAIKPVEPDYLSILPDDIKVLIIPFLADAATIDQAIRNIKSLATTNKAFNELINTDPYLAGQIAKALAQRFKVEYDNGIGLEMDFRPIKGAVSSAQGSWLWAALRLNTPAARQWINTFISNNTKDINLLLAELAQHFTVEYNRLAMGPHPTPDVNIARYLPDNYLYYAASRIDSPLVAQAVKQNLTPQQKANLGEGIIMVDPKMDAFVKKLKATI